MHTDDQNGRKRECAVGVILLHSVTPANRILIRRKFRYFFLSFRFKSLLLLLKGIRFGVRWVRIDANAMHEASVCMMWIWNRKRCNWHWTCASEVILHAEVERVGDGNGDAERDDATWKFHGIFTFALLLLDFGTSEQNPFTFASRGRLSRVTSDWVNLLLFTVKHFRFVSAFCFLCRLEATVGFDDAAKSRMARRRLTWWTSPNGEFHWFDLKYS